MPLAAPQLVSAMPAASASLTAVTGNPVADADDRLDVGTDPAAVDVGRRASHARLDDGRESATERALPTEMAYDLGDGGRHGDREGGLRRQDLVALGRELPDFEVDDSPLDARAPYVHPKAKQRHEGA